MRLLGLVCALALLLAPDPAGAGGGGVAGGQQVMIKVKVVETSRTQARDLGFDWSGFNPTIRPIQPGFSDIPSLEPVFSGKRGRVLSAPRVLTLDGREADVFVGGDLTVEDQTFPETGIGMTFVPRVTADGRILLDVEMDVDQFAISGGMPSISSRNLELNIPLLNGHLAVIGGLFTNETRETAGRVPWLSEIPVLGNLFRNVGFARSQTELLIFVTPRIVREGGSGGGRNVPTNPQVTHPKVDPNLKSPKGPQYPQSPQYPTQKKSPGYNR